MFFILYSDEIHKFVASLEVRNRAGWYQSSDFEHATMRRLSGAAHGNRGDTRLIIPWPPWPNEIRLPPNMRRSRRLLSSFNQEPRSLNATPNAE